MSINANPLRWFEIPVLDIARATAFYEAVFDLKLSPMEMGPRKLAFFPMDGKVYGAGGALIQMPGCIPSHSGKDIYFGVNSIDESLLKVAKAGGKMLQPKESIGEFGFIAFFEDHEGNRIGLHENVANMK